MAEPPRREIEHRVLRLRIAKERSRGALQAYRDALVNESRTMDALIREIDAELAATEADEAPAPVEAADDAN